MKSNLNQFVLFFVMNRAKIQGIMLAAVFCLGLIGYCPIGGGDGTPGPGIR